MTLTSRLLSAVAGLPPAQTRRVKVERDIPVPTPDGVVLLADRWYPDLPSGERAPILLARIPYGRPEFLGRIFAERGYQTVLVSCRGTFGSGGEWRPYFNERADGHAVLDWLAEQPWFAGNAGTFGASYFGLTQWAIASDAPRWLNAMAPGVTASNFRDGFYRGGSFTLENALVWLYDLEHQERSWPARRRAMMTARRRLAAAYSAVPLLDADLAAVSRRVAWYRDWLEHDAPDDPWWAPVDFGRGLDRAPPMSMVTGWYDLFLPDQLADFGALRRAGRQARLTVGPWRHAHPAAMGAMLRDTLDWADIHLRGRPSDRDTPVRVFVMGARRWVDLPDWPPPATPTRWHLQPGGGLATERSPDSAPDVYRYDPADPTPSVGGASLDVRNGGPKDNRSLLSRPDVLTYSSEALTADVTVIGEISARLHVRSSLEHTDFFVRLCDVAPKGRSTNLCDGIVRVRPGDPEKHADGSYELSIGIFPTANTFRRGHRIRLQVSSGAHPLYARNPGSGEPLGKATTLVPAEQEIFHDPDHPSALMLPVVPTVSGRPGRLRRVERV